MGRRMGPRAGPDAAAKTNILTPADNQTPVMQPRPSHYIDRATPAPLWFVQKQDVRTFLFAETTVTVMLGVVTCILWRTVLTGARHTMHFKF